MSFCTQNINEGSDNALFICQAGGYFDAMLDLIPVANTSTVKTVTMPYDSACFDLHILSHVAETGFAKCINLKEAEHSS